MPADETPLLNSPRVQEGSSRVPTWCKWPSWCSYFRRFYSLTLLAEWGLVIYYIYCYIQAIYPFTPLAWQDVNVTGTRKTNADASQDVDVNFANAAITVVCIDTWNCWMFLVTIGMFYKKRPADNSTSHAHNSTSPYKLLKFWVLMLDLVLYVTGAFLLIFSYCIIPDDVKFKPVSAVVYSLLIVNAISMVGIVVSLNYVKVQSLAQGNSRYKYFLQAALVTFLVSIIVSLMTSVFTILVFSFRNNSGVSRAITFSNSVGEVLIIPFNKKIAELIATKVAHDEKYILGKCKSVDETLV